MPRAELSVKTAHELNKIKQMRDEMFTTYFKENKSDIMTLQEVTDIPRLQECLKRAGLSDTYGIYVDTSERPTDKVILYNKSRFQLIERDAPQGPKDRNLRHADIVLKDTRSGKEIVVASAHVPGFPDSDRDDKNATKTGTDEVIASCAALKQTSQVVLFGADLNDSRRVQHFVEAGFKSDSSSLPTRRHWDREKKAPASHERIDFALARNVKKLTPMKNGLSQVDSFGDQNPSDHLPVSSKVIY